MTKIFLTLQQLATIREAVALLPQTRVIALDQGGVLLERGDVTVGIYDSKVRELELFTLNTLGDGRE